MLWRLALISLAGCGRIGFEVASQPADAFVHDDDGDGVGDVVDNCPCIVGPQLDSDNDGVGDACDPNPLVARDRLEHFWTMSAADNPFTTKVDPGAAWIQDNDGLRLDGDLAGDYYAGLTASLATGDVQVAFGFDITAIGNATAQHQFSISTRATDPQYFPEINERIGEFSFASITYFDGAYSQIDTEALASGIHTGTVTFVATHRVGGTLRLDVGWPGEPYVVEVNDPLFQGADVLQVNINNLQLEIRYVCVITST